MSIESPADETEIILRVQSTLAQIAPIAISQPGHAQEQMIRMIDSLPHEQLKELEPSIRDVVEAFLPKRRRRLMEHLETRLTESKPARPPAPVVSPTPATLLQRFTAAAPAPQIPAARSTKRPVTQAEVDDRLAGLEEALRELSEKHIFQWQTLYRDWLSEDFDWFLDALSSYVRYPQVLEKIHEALVAHSAEIFEKGRRHQINQGETEQYAIDKSVKGLQSFLDLPIEFYSARLSTAADVRQARGLRALTSSMLSAILTGYSLLNFGSQSGSEVLARYPRSWAHALAFFTPDDLDALLEHIEHNEFVRGLLYYLTPLVEAIESLGEGREHMPLPALSQLRSDAGRIDIWLRPSTLSPYPQLIELECYLGERYVRQPDLHEAVRRGVTVAVVPVRAGSAHVASTDPRLRQTVVYAEADPSKVAIARDAIKAPLAARAYHQGTASTRRQPLGHNVARSFPRDNPNLLPYYIVHRQSVRDLFRTFESRSGVRLWCSVRRSGKTTAGARLDADTTTGQVTVVKQTCDTTGETPNDNVFYKQVQAALVEADWLPETFFRDLVLRCGDGQAISDRTVFVLDEYETLFGALSASLRRDPDLRYFVVQPLLNQMVEFSRENLIIFLGQQPNAHYILMDQNQLSPYVQQDSFPLFSHSHGEPREEFAQLIRKVLANPVNPDASFIDAVYGETAGHPYLTVSMLYSLVDWLIAEKRPVNRLELTREEFDQFAAVRLRPSDVHLNRDFGIFHEAAREALSEAGRQRSPWLHQVYGVLRAVALSSPETLRCTRSDFAEIAAGFSDGIDTGRLLATASDSNFFAYDDNYVWPQIRLLGRIAAVSHGGVV
ncbi:hypothetical protein [Micromonospora sp. WMMD964]|uniref:hypothetical protein n=1 Tax=Micromonospora sp. WMMD964 TaxID=3016091 RepID=UPI00249B4094|nr:hypothetical protein [Micromonospora sp. WMMD964]WFE98619.1 hypothetical protein O7616_17060 [Micromonospora sp. WMMD964]